MIAESHIMNVKLHSGTELYSSVKLQNAVEVHFDYEISIHERDVELPNIDVHSDLATKRSNEENRA